MWLKQEHLNAGKSDLEGIQVIYTSHITSTVVRKAKRRCASLNRVLDLLYKELSSWSVLLLVL